MHQQLMAYLWLEAQAHAASRQGPEAEKMLSYLTCVTGRRCAALLLCL